MLFSDAGYYVFLHGSFEHDALIYCILRMSLIVCIFQDERAYTLRPDSQISLTARGMEQAVQTGQKVRELIGDEGKVYCYVSPYLRALQTLLCIGKSIEMDRVAGVREEPRLREQDFGNLQARAPEALQQLL